MPRKSGPAGGRPSRFQHQRGMAPVGHPVELAQRHPHVQRGRDRPAVRPRPSTARTTSASSPSPALKVKYRSAGQAQADALRTGRSASAGRTCPAASTGSAAGPSARVNTFALPPGSAASAGRAAPVDRVRAEDAVDRLVDGAVAAEREHQPEAVVAGGCGERGRVPPVACLHDLELDGGRQGDGR